MTNPTPPQPPEMPKPDFQWHYTDCVNIRQDTHAWVADKDGATSIERAYSELSRVAQQQRERAEKAEEELVYKQDHIDEEVAINDHLQAENARLREALEMVKRHQELVCPNGHEMSFTWRIANAALHRTSEASEQRSPTPEATPHEEAGETTDE